MFYLIYYIISSFYTCTKCTKHKMPMDYLLIIIALRSFKHIIIIEDGLNFDSIHDRFRIYRLNNDLKKRTMLVGKKELLERRRTFLLEQLHKCLITRSCETYF